MHVWVPNMIQDAFVSSRGLGTPWGMGHRSRNTYGLTGGPWDPVRFPSASDRLSLVCMLILRHESSGFQCCMNQDPQEGR